MAVQTGYAVISGYITLSIFGYNYEDYGVSQYAVQADELDVYGNYDRTLNLDVWSLLFKNDY